MSGASCRQWSGASGPPNIGRRNEMTKQSRAGRSGVGRKDKGAQRRGAWIVHLDEGDFSQHPSIVRTWAPRGQAPIVRMNFNWGGSR